MTTTFAARVETLDVDKWDDGRLVEAIQGGGRLAPRAASAIVTRYRPWMVRLARGLLTERDDAEDLVQEVFVRAFAALGRFDNKASLKGWLRTILVRLAHNWRRDRRTARLYEGIAASESDMPQRGACGERSMIGRQELMWALENLEPEARRVVSLYCIRGLSIQEIAGRTGLTISAVKMRLKRSRARLAELKAQDAPLSRAA